VESGCYFHLNENYPHEVEIPTCSDMMAIFLPFQQKVVEKFILMQLKNTLLCLSVDCT